MTEYLSFAVEIEAYKSAMSVSPEVVGIKANQSVLNVRKRGAYVTLCELTSPTSGQIIPIFHPVDDLEKTKPEATHSMLPAGPNDGPGGQHGFTRWADYKIETAEMPDGGKLLTATAQQVGDLAFRKTFLLTDSSITISAHAQNISDKTVHTSIGEHAYFDLTDDNLEGLKVNGLSLDELLHINSNEIFADKGTLYWQFPGEAKVEFPAGHSINLSTKFKGDSVYPSALWVWKSPTSDSLCLEPIEGVEHLDDLDRSGVVIPPQGSATLITKIELL